MKLLGGHGGCLANHLDVGNEVNHECFALRKLFLSYLGIR